MINHKLVYTVTNNFATLTIIDLINLGRFTSQFINSCFCYMILSRKTSSDLLLFLNVYFILPFRQQSTSHSKNKKTTSIKIRFSLSDKLLPGQQIIFVLLIAHDKKVHIKLNSFQRIFYKIFIEFFLQIMKSF